jgi:23S rRNA pseudouridine2604 synthase
MALLRHGLELDGEALLPATVEWVNDDQLRFVLQEGKKRPDPAHVRRGRPAGARPQARSHRRGHARRAAVGQWRYLRLDERFVAAPAR